MCETQCQRMSEKSPSKGIHSVYLYAAIKWEEHTTNTDERENIKMF
jgi:hypothetical protein